MPNREIFWNDAVQELFPTIRGKLNFQYKQTENS